MTDETHDVTARARTYARDGITPGPWETYAYGSTWTVESVNDCTIVVDTFNDGVGAGVIKDVDANFIAAAPDLVRDLLAEVERLRERKANVARAGGHIAGVMQRERDEARAEVERLEADLDGAAYRAGRKQGELAEALAWAAWFAAAHDHTVKQSEAFGFGEFRVTTWAYEQAVAAIDKHRAAVDRVRKLAEHWRAADSWHGNAYADDVLRALDGEADRG